VRPLRVGIATLIAIELSKILGPSRPTKPPASTKAQVMAEKLALGVVLLRIKGEEPARFGAIAHELHKVDPKSAVVYRTMAAARLYANRSEITDNVTWDTLRELAAPTLPSNLRRKLKPPSSAARRSERSKSGLPASVRRLSRRRRWQLEPSGRRPHLRLRARRIHAVLDPIATTSRQQSCEDQDHQYAHRWLISCRRTFQSAPS
jgi:hypothetical protein